VLTVWDEPELLGLFRKLKDSAAELNRNHWIFLAMDDQKRQRTYFYE
jgi:hypothetical protein